jgi:hypothetical protein
MLDVRFSHAFQTVGLDELDDPAKARLHIRGQGFDFSRDPPVQQFDDPSHT